MRNRWYPQRKASYVTDSQLKELGGVVVERDALFGLEEEVEKREEEQMVEVQMKLLPVITTKLLQRPQTLTFMGSLRARQRSYKPSYHTKWSSTGRL